LWQTRGNAGFCFPAKAFTNLKAVQNRLCNSLHNPVKRTGQMAGHKKRFCGASTPKLYFVIVVQLSRFRRLPKFFGESKIKL